MKILYVAIFGVSALSSCSTGEFTGSADAIAVQKKKCEQSVDKNCIDDKNFPIKPSLETDDDGAITGNCKFTDITVQSEGFLIPGGPPIRIRPSDLQNGVKEGDTLFVDLNAYQGPAGAGGAKTNKNYAATLDSDGSVLIPAELPTYTPHIIPATFGNAWHKSDEWSLTAFPRKGGQVPVAIKHEFRVQVASVNSANCTILAHRVVQPYYTRGPSFYDPTTDYDTGGCFALSTKIKMADGTEKLAVNIEKGDRLFNPVTKKSVTVSEVVYGPEENLGLIVVGIGENAVKVTTQHPFETHEGLKAAADLKLDDKIRTVDGTFKRLTTLNVLSPVKNQRVINFMVSSNSKKPIDHMVLADGVVTGDLYLQRKLGRQMSPKLLEKSPAVAVSK